MTSLSLYVVVVIHIVIWECGLGLNHYFVTCVARELEIWSGAKSLLKLGLWLSVRGILLCHGSQRILGRVLHSLSQWALIFIAIAVIFNDEVALFYRDLWTYEVTITGEITVLAAPLLTNRTFHVLAKLHLWAHRRHSVQTLEIQRRHVLCTTAKGTEVLQLLIRYVLWVQHVLLITKGDDSGLSLLRPIGCGVVATGSHHRVVPAADIINIIKISLEIFTCLIHIIQIFDHQHFKSLENAFHQVFVGIFLAV